VIEMDKGKTIRIKTSTYKRLESIGRKGETFDDLIQKLLDKEAKKE
jgi:predicted CopG family antitoxin